MEEQNPKLGRRCQGELIFTASNSSQNGASPQKSAKKLRTLLQPPPSPPPLQQRPDASPWHLHRVSAPPGEFSNFDRPNPRMPPSLLYSPSRCGTPSKPSRSLQFTAESLLPHTPATSQQKCPLPMSAKKIKHRAAMKLKALENERLEASHYEQDRSAALLEAQEKTHAAWLNHVLLKPMTAKHSTVDLESETSSITSNESRWSSYSDPTHISSDSVLNIGDKIPAFDCLASPTGKRTPRADKLNAHSMSSIGTQAKEGNALDAALQAICSIPVLRSRLDACLDAKCREEVISVMIKVSKHIDDGRLRMKDGCAILTDVALKENFIQTMLTYNAPWLKIGLHVVLGHNALVTEETLESMAEGPNQWDADRETQQAILRLLIERDFLSHPGLAKHHATNKRIEGLYKQGYHEALARVILKRILLLVLTLDKAKCQSTIPLMCGIDGIDGGSPILFLKSGQIKSSRHALQEFLLNSMHGEGDVVGHLGVLGYHVTHVQAGLADYSFEIENLIEDVKDGVRLCRLVQVLLADPSLLVKIKIPSDRPRRRNHNCSIALERLARAGVSVLDAFGCLITADDLVEGHRERVVQLLWNIMLHLQIPAMVNLQRLRQEIIRISSCDLDAGSRLVDDSSVSSLLLIWIQAICMKFEFRVRNFASSFADGQALCYLISYYCPMLLPQAAIQGYNQCSLSLSPFSANTKAFFGKTTETLKGVAAHNLALFQLAISKLGSIPQVLQVSHFVEGDPFVSEQSVIIMLAFLYYRLVEAPPKVEEKMATLSWNPGWKLSFELSKEIGCDGPESEPLEMSNASAMEGSLIENVAKQQHLHRQGAKVIQAAVRNWLTSTRQKSQQNEAATVIQAYLRGWIVRRGCNFLESHSSQMTSCQEQACLRIQRNWRLHSSRKLYQSKQAHLLSAVCKLQAWWRKCLCREYFIEIKAAAVLVQSHFRSTREARHYRILKKSVVKLQALVKGRCARRQYCKYKRAATTIQSHWRCVLLQRLSLKQKHEAALKIQSHWRKFNNMRSYARKTNAAIFLQRCWKNISASRKRVASAIRLQSQWRKYSSRKCFITKKAAATLIQKWWREYVSNRISKQRKKEAVLKIQSHWRKYNVRKSYAATTLAIAIIQHYARGCLAKKKYLICKEAVTKLQALVRSRQQRRRLHIILQSVRIIQCCWRRYLNKREAARQQAKAHCAAIKLQASWRRFSARKSFWALSANIVKIQSSVRSYICRTRYNRVRQSVTRIQALVRTRLARTKYLKMKDTVVKIQAFYRGRRQLRNYETCRKSITRLQAFVRGKRERNKFIESKDAAITIQKHFRKHINCTQLLKARQSISAMRIQHAWRSMQLREAAIVIQSHYRGWKQKRVYLMKVHKITWLQAKVREFLFRRRLLKETEMGGPTSAQSEVYTLSEDVPKLKEMLDWQMASHLEEKQSDLNISAVRLQRCWRKMLNRRHNAATTIQKYYRCWLASKAFRRARANIICIQAIWRGFRIRHKHGHLKEELSALRQRMQSTAANVDKRMRLEYRLTEALEALLSQKTVSGILHTCATIDLATQHSKLCCERLLDAGAVPKLLQLIQTTNRSPPHEEILKHSLSILGNLARYPSFAPLVINAPGSLAIVAEQILRNNEEVLAKILKLLQLLCKVPSGPDAIRRNPMLMKRLNNFSQVLEKKVETEARALARLPHTATAARRLSEKKVTDAVSQHRSVVMILQKATGEDLKTRLKAVKRLSSITAAAPPRRMSVVASRPSNIIFGRVPLQDCSNN
ncbi:hypothetical protein GOP47_0005279 [Adiantum capillus-veneris]|uniref:Calponin-homology (CH) domain-containing protein n=1 Tax=Adiantum capillus-veneris TaxID=13818 RepID=A0A9D4V4T4_ADICA|nr:hypothetical protein GOP47_0005279 [Adiantum capillus-veneris]